VVSADEPLGRDDFFGHPRGLLVLAATEFWDRISFHGMQALLVLYMVGQLLRPGHLEHIRGMTTLRGIIESATGPLSSQALAFQIFGLYIGFIYLSPLFGGLLGDRLLGRRRTVQLGAMLMTLGHFSMAFEPPFLLALLLLVLGAGCLRGNLMAQVGYLYPGDEGRRGAAFQIYYAVLNTGAFISPLAIGALAQRWGWHVGFAAAGFGMLMGLIIYWAGRRHLPPEAPRSTVATRARLSEREKRVVWVLWIMLIPLSLFWIAQTQIWNTYNIWARDHVDLLVRGFHIPVPWLQSFDALAAIVMVPPVVVLWRWQARSSVEPDEFAKLIIGCAIFAAAMAWLAAASLAAGASSKVPLVWVLGFHVLSSIGWIYFAPVAIALYSRTAPAMVNSMMLGAYYLSMFLGSVISGRLGGYYERLSAAQFWLVHAALVGLAGLLLMLFIRPLRRELLQGPTVNEASLLCST
jgi:POT family proton-dependent oligopeptide transporter